MVDSDAECALQVDLYNLTGEIAAPRSPVPRHTESGDHFDLMGDDNIVRMAEQLTKIIRQSTRPAGNAHRLVAAGVA
jgi:hypothetical protein